MSSNYLVICDEDEVYAARLAEYFNRKRELAFQVKICRSPKEIPGVMADSSKSILLLNEVFFTNDLVKEWQGEVLILSEMKRETDYGQCKSLFKYQTANKLLLPILEKCDEQNIGGVWRVRKSTKSKVIGLFSPVHRVGQTTFALEKARELSKEFNV